MSGTIAFACFISIIVGIIFWLGFVVGRRYRQIQLEDHFLSEFFDWCRRQDQQYLARLVAERLTATIDPSRKNS